MRIGAEVVKEELELPPPVVILAEGDHPGDEEGVGPDLTPGAVPGACKSFVVYGDCGGDCQLWRVTGAGVVNQATGAGVMFPVIFH